jgi:4-amino-4-deoxy-L-arabinose transferase-like glycosyltransferase
VLPARVGSFRAVVALSVVLAVVLRAPFFGTPLGVDEGGLAYVAQHWVRHGTSVYGDQWLDRPPLLVLLIRVAVSAGGDAGVRVLGALAATALVVVVALLARAIGGARAGRYAAVAAAVLGSSIALQAVYTPAELLAAVPAAASVLCLILGLRSGRPGFLVAAGALATSAALVKQSFLDAGLAGVVFLTACAVRRPPGFRWAWVVAWAAGAALPALAVLAAAGTGYVGGRDLPYALVGFRVDALRTLAGSGDAASRFRGLAMPAAASGLVVAIAFLPAGLRRLRGDPIVAATLVAWLVGGLVGVTGGGTYWSHYLIQIVPVSTVLFGIAIAQMRPAFRVSFAPAAVILACVAAVGATAYVAKHHPHAAERAVGTYIRAHARPGDTQYVLYARANVLHYGGLPTPFPYDWSLMVRAARGARPALYRLLASPRRPTWLVTWQDDDRWRLDRGAIVDGLLRRHYRPAATVDGHVILRRIAPAAA